jgi:hypothetical protein
LRPKLLLASPQNHDRGCSGQEQKQQCDTAVQEIPDPWPKTVPEGLQWLKDGDRQPT